MAEDDRILPPQLRKSIAPGVKNGYDCELKYSQGQHKEESHQYLRCATLVYAGSDSKKEERAKHITENLAQLKAYCDTKPIHVSMLNTVAPYSKEYRLVYETMNAIGKNKDKEENAFSYLPLNMDGTCRIPVIAPAIKAACKHLTAIVHMLRQGTRTLFAARVAHGSQQTHKSLSTCASGQDRTGTHTLTMKALWLRDYTIKVVGKKKGLHACYKHFAVGQHNAALASLAIPGSRGMKTQTQPSGLLEPKADDKVSERFYLETASHNKSTPVQAIIAKKIGCRAHAFVYKKDAQGGLSFGFQNIVDGLRQYKETASSYSFGYAFWFSGSLLKEKKKVVSEFLDKSLQKFLELPLQKALAQLRDDLADLQRQVNEARDETNKNSFFTHHKGRLEAFLDTAVKHVDYAEACEEQGVSDKTYLSHTAKGA